MLIVLESILWVIRVFFSEPVSLVFLNVVIDRLPRGESVVNGRSHCTNCGRVLHAWELIPCVSYIFLRGRCAGCKNRIPGRDFFVEVIGGAAFIGCGIHYGCGSFGLLSMRGTVMLIYFGILLVVALIDWDTQIIYDRFSHFYFDISNCKYMACSGAWAYRQADRGVDHLCSDAASGTCDPGSIWRRGYKLMRVSGAFLGTGR